MNEDDPRIFELPFPFGSIVFHKLRSEKIPGMVTAFNFRRGRTTCGVTWGNDLCEMYHLPEELVTEYQPLFPGS